MYLNEKYNKILTFLIRKFRFYKELILIQGRLLWLFIFLPASVFGISYLFWELSNFTWHITAYSMQFGAYSIFLCRLNSLFKHYNPKDVGYIGEIKSWIKRLFVRPVGKPDDSEVNVEVTSTAISTAHGKYKLPSDPSKSDIIQWVKSEIKLIQDKIKETKCDIYSDIDALREVLEGNIENINSKLELNQIKDRELHLPNLGRELIAVLWLISAATIFALTNIAW